MRAGGKRRGCYRNDKAGDGKSKNTLILYLHHSYGDGMSSFRLLSRKWDWLTTTLIMPETTVPTWPNHIAAGPPCFQSFSLGMRGWCTMLISAGNCQRIKTLGTFYLFICAVLLLCKYSNRVCKRQASVVAHGKISLCEAYFQWVF